MDRGDPEEAIEQLSRPAGLAVVAGQIWLEAAQRIYSSKEQDGLLAEAARAAGFPEVHTLYHATFGVQPGRAEAAAPLVREMGKHGADFFRGLRTVPRRYRASHPRGLIWTAWVRYLTATLALAPFKGHPADVYKGRGALQYWTAARPAAIVKELRENGAPSL
jgi:hypothetical protein